MEINELLDLRIKEGLEEMEEKIHDTECYRATAESVKLLIETKLSCKQSSIDIEYEKKRFLLDIVKFLLGMGFTGLQIMILLRFEETGVLRSKAWNWLPKFGVKI